MDPVEELDGIGIDDTQEEEFVPRPMRFMLNHGSYCEKGKKYGTGDIIESYRQLDVLFKGTTFTRVTEGEALTEPIPEKRDNGFRTLRRNGNLFDVVNTKTGEVINDGYLTLEEAKELERAAGVPFDQMPEHLLSKLHEIVRDRYQEIGTLLK